MQINKGAVVGVGDCNMSADAFRTIQMLFVATCLQDTHAHTHVHTHTLSQWLGLSQKQRSMSCMPLAVEPHWFYCTSGTCC
jgi:hypothetical protein